MNHLNIDRAVSCVKTIADTNRCFTCDQLNISSVRYPCGHSICKNCFVTQEYCLLCLSQQNPCPKLIDESLNLRALHASELVTAFQDVFNVDVDRRPRISDKLKLEKLLFPKCIQAPVKYVNKRKTLNTPDRLTNISSKLSILPGENTYRSVPKMENKIEYIHQWLNDNESIRKKPIRKPLEDLNLNCTNFSHMPKNNIPPSIKNCYKNKKRAHTENFLLDNKMKQFSPKRVKKKIEPEDNPTVNNVNINTEKTNLGINESGIVIDDETDFIENSQSVCNDNNTYESPISLEAALDDKTTTVFSNSLNNKKILPNITSNINKSINKSVLTGRIHQVAFYRRSSLKETCKLCNEFDTCVNKKRSFNNITITIESKAFLTSINVTDCNQKTTGLLHRRKSVKVQTDINNKDLSAEVMLTKINTKNDKELDTLHVVKSLKNTNFANGNIINVDKPETKNDVSFAKKEQKSYESDILPQSQIMEDLPISESDSDEFCNRQNVIEVSADVHNSCSLIDYEVLNTLQPHEYEHRNKHATREHTPGSTDSSDKENYDPNRIRRTKNRGKKCESKK